MSNRTAIGAHTGLAALAFACTAFLDAVFAQEQGPQPEPARQAQETQERSLTGDVIRFKDGTVLDNVQVLRETPRALTVQIADGVEMDIPRRRIQSVEYDDFDPTRQKRIEQLFPPPAPPNEIKGHLISPQLLARLNAPVSPVPLNFEQRGLAKIFEDLAKSTGLPYEIDDSVRQIPADEKQWTIQTTPDMTLDRFLEAFKERFPNLAVLYEFDKVVILTKEAAQARQDTPSPPPGVQHN